VVTTHLSRIVMSPLPTGVIEVVVDNRDSAPARIAMVEASGSGVRQVVTTQVDQPVAAGALRRVQVSVPLNCGRLVDDVGPPTVVVGVSTGAGPLTPFTAIATGPAMTQGLCPSAMEQLPEGWHDRVVLRHLTADDAHLTLSVGGLPAGTTEVLYVRADDWSLVITSPPQAPVDGEVSLTVLRPVPDCFALPARPTLPAGVQIMVSGPRDGPQLLYLPVGPDLSRWLLAAWDTACAARAVT
jgi:hypothetical protein